MALPLAMGMLKAKAMPAAPPAPDADAPDEDSERVQELTPAATSLIAAMKTGDAAAVAKALASAYDACSHSGGAADEAGEGE